MSNLTFFYQKEKWDEVIITQKKTDIDDSVQIRPRSDLPTKKSRLKDVFSRLCAQGATGVRLVV